MDAPEVDEEDQSVGDKAAQSAGPEEVQVALQSKGGPTVSSWVHRKNTAGE